MDSTQPAPSKPEWTVLPGKEKKNRKTLFASIGIVIIAFAAGFFLFSSPLTGFVTAGKGVQAGDMVSVLYTGRTEGKVFDSNIASEALAAGLDRQTFEPLRFKAGSGQVIPGFDNAVLGMHKGEKKTVTLTPAQAYGQPNPALIEIVPRSTSLNRTEEVPLIQQVPADQFLQYFGLHKEGDIVTVPNSNVPYRVTAVSDSLVTLQMLTDIGARVQLPGYQWNSTVIAIIVDKVMVRHDPEEKPITTPIGDADVKIDALNDKIIITANPRIGESISTPFGAGKIVAVDAANISIDFNSPLAGKTLEFDIQVIDIYKDTTAAAPQAAQPAAAPTGV